MRRELGQSIGIIVEPDPQEENFRKKVGEWVHDEISYDDVMKHLPDHYYPVEQRVVRRVVRRVSQAISQIRR